MIKIKKEKVVRAIIESTLNLALKRAKSDPKRSVRNVVELALNNSHGRFQRNLFDGAQRMLKNENSAYYTLAERVVYRVDHDKLKKFVINMGYNGFTCGAEHIRQNEQRFGFNIPWTFYIFAQNEEEEFTDNVRKLVSQGMELGVYVYFVFGDTSISEGFREIYREFDDCAFIIMCDAECINDDVTEHFEKIDNVMISVGSDNIQQITTACNMMKSKKQMYCIHRFYDDDSALGLFAEDKLKFYDDIGAPFVCMIPLKDCGEESRKVVNQKVLDIRFGQKYPYFAIDFAADMTEIDHIISDDTCWVLFDSNGTVISSTGTYSGDKYNLSSVSLKEILCKVTPPKFNHS